MLVKLNGLPIEQVADSISQTAYQVNDIITQPLTIEFAYGNYHLVSADLNLINAPHHIVDGFIHVIDIISNII